MKPDELVLRAQNFAVEVIQMVRKFPKDPASYVLDKQIIRSSTSVSANIVEAQSAISKKEFIVYMNIAKREVKESLNWLAIIAKSDLVTSGIDAIIQEGTELAKILTAIVKTSQLHQHQPT